MKHSYLCGIFIAVEAETRESVWCSIEGSGFEGAWTIAPNAFDNVFYKVCACVADSFYAA